MTAINYKLKKTDVNDEQATEMKKIVFSRKKKITIFIFMILLPFIGLLLLEAILQLFWAQPPRGFTERLFIQEHDITKVKQGIKGRQYSREFDVSVEGNKLGYRKCPGFAPEKKPDIILLGDSYCFGWGVEAEETAGARIAKATGLNIYNLGMPGDDVFRQIKRLKEINPGKCRAIILLFFDNDLSDEFRRTQSAGVKKEDGQPPSQKALESSPVNLRQKILQSHVVRLVGRAVDACGLSSSAANVFGFKQLQAKAFKEVMQAHRKVFYDSAAWKRLEAEYVKLFNAARQESDKVFVIRIVAPFVKDFKIPENSDYDLNLCDINMLRLSNENGVKYLTFSPENDEQYFYRFDQHLNPSGHKVLAEFIMDNIDLTEKKQNKVSR